MIFGMGSQTDIAEKIYLAVLRNQELSDVDVKETPENIELYWKLSSDVAKMRKDGIAPSVPN
jgi:hypothetical protein